VSAFHTGALKGLEKANGSQLAWACGQTGRQRSPVRWGICLYTLRAEYPASGARDEGNPVVAEDAVDPGGNTAAGGRSRRADEGPRRTLITYGTMGKAPEDGPIVPR